MKKLCFLLVLALCAVSLCPAFAEDKPFKGTTLTVFNCYDYIDPAVLDLFEEETGARIDYCNYTTNEEMYTKLEAGAAEYDIIFPSDYMVERLIAQDMLEELDMSAIPNREGLLDWIKVTDFDPESKFSVPYMWGTLGFLYNKDMVTEEVTGWDVLFNEKYAGSIIMMNSQRDALAIALKQLGFSLNTRNEDELRAAADLLIEQKTKGITSGYLLDETKDKMVGNEAAIGVVYSGDAIYAMEKNPSLEYCIPAEGTNVWVDTMCIPKGSRNKECAEAFINFMCREDIALMNVEYIYYSSPIKAAAEAIDTGDERCNAAMNPTEEQIANCEYFHDILDCMDLYESVWMDVRLAR
jgi:Spermidine/putrescine-binding periplasmic protein